MWLKTSLSGKSCSRELCSLNPTDSLTFAKENVRSEYKGGWDNFTRFISSNALCLFEIAGRYIFILGQYRLMTLDQFIFLEHFFLSICRNPIEGRSKIKYSCKNISITLFKYVEIFLFWWQVLIKKNVSLPSRRRWKNVNVNFDFEKKYRYCEEFLK